MAEFSLTVWNFNSFQLYCLVFFTDELYRSKQWKISRLAALFNIKTNLNQLRASSYEPGNRAGPVTGSNFVVCSYGKFQPGYRDEKESKRARNVDWGPGNEFEHA